MSEQITVFFQIVFIDLVLAGDNAIIIGMVASQFAADQRKKDNFLGNRWSCNFKNNSNFNNSIFTTNNRFKVNWWINSALYSL